MTARIRRWLPLAALLLAATPFVIAVVAAMRDHWLPLGDDAVTGILAHDVLSTRTPLVGMPSTIKTATAFYPAHHPGPLLFWALALPERLSGSAPIGLLIGAALVNVLAVVAIGIVTRRVAGNGAALGALTIVVVLAWGLGRQAIVDVWNPYLAVFPMLALFVTAWAVFAGHRRLLWLVALLASFVAEAHILFVPIGIVFGGAAAAFVVAGLIRLARTGAPWKHEAAGIGGSTALVLAIVWSFPIFEQLTQTPGNFTDIDRSLGAQQQGAVGIGYALRVMVQSVGVLPLFARQSSSFVLVGRSWSELGLFKIVGAIVVVGLLALGTVVAIRRRDRIALTAGLTAALALIVTTIVVALLPAQPIDIVRYRLIECWAVGAFVWFAVGVMLVRAAPVRVTERPAVRWTAAAVAGALLVVLPISTAFANTFDHDDTRLYRVVSTLAHDANPKLAAHTRYRIELHTDTGLLGTTVEYGLMRELARHGRAMYVDRSDIYLSRSHTAPPGTTILQLLVGKTALASPPTGATLLARAASATPADVARLTAVDNGVRRYLSNRHVLSGRGRAALAAGDARLVPLFDGHTDPLTLVHDGAIGRLWEAGLLRADVFTGNAYRAYTHAHDVVEQYVFALYLVPT